jgi:LysM repeat protein
MPTIKQIQAKRAAYQARVRQAGSVKAAEAEMRQISANYHAGLDQGLSQAEAATTWVLPKPNYTVKQGDTVASIANATGLSVDALLNANPDVTIPKTGMVLSTPALTSQIAGEKNYNPIPASAGSEVWRTQQQNSGTWANNAAYGSTTTNPQGNNYAAQQAYMQNNPDVQAGMQAYSSSIQQQSRAINQTYVDARGNVQTGNPFASYQNVSRTTLRSPQGSISVAPVQTSPNINGQAPITGPHGASEAESMSNILDQILAETGPQYDANGNLISNGRMATDWEMNLLKYYSAITPASQTASSGGGSRGGGYGKSVPAFGSGSGFGGLVNWRI